MPLVPEDLTPAASEARQGDDPVGLIWGIKRSFMRYLTMVPDSRVELDGGAEMVGDSMLVFPLESMSLDPETLTGILQFGGGALLEAHEGMMQIYLANPRLDISLDRAVLTLHPQQVEPAATAGVPVSASSGKSAQHGRSISVAEALDGLFEHDAEALLWSAEEVLLLDEGIALFGGQYQQGQALDSLYIRIPVVKGTIRH